MSFNSVNTYDWFRQRIYKLEDEKHDFTSMPKALEKAMEDMATSYARVPTGLFYKTERPTFESMDLALKDKPALIKQQLPTKEQVLALLDENR